MGIQCDSNFHAVCCSQLISIFQGFFFKTTLFSLLQLATKGQVLLSFSFIINFSLITCATQFATLSMKISLKCSLQALPHVMEKSLASFSQRYKNVVRDNLCFSSMYLMTLRVSFIMCNNDINLNVLYNICQCQVLNGCPSYISNISLSLLNCVQA